MPQFSQLLNEDGLGIKTSARYDTGAATWLADAANYIQNASGVWVPLGESNPMPVKGAALGTPADAAVSDPALEASEIALLKGLIKQLQGDGTADKAAPVKLTGSLPVGTNAIGKVSAADDVKAQPLVVAPTIDLRGKTAGQIFDVPHVARYNLGSVFAIPGGGSEISQAAYVNAGALDGVSYSASTPTNAYYAQQTYSFDVLNALRNNGTIPKSWGVAELKAAIKSLGIIWHGYGVGSNGGVSTNGAKYKLWSESTSQWVEWYSNGSSSPGALGSSNMLLNGNYIDSTGKIHLLVHPTYPSDGIIASIVYSDYVKLDVQLTGEYLQTDVGRALDQSTWALKTALVSRPIEEVVVWNALAITNTTAIYSPTIDLSKYRQVLFIVINTLDQPVKIDVPIDNTNGSTMYWNGSAWAPFQLATIPGSGVGYRHVLNAFNLNLDRPLRQVRCYAKCDTAPLSGSLTLKVWGVPN